MLFARALGTYNAPFMLIVNCDQHFYYAIKCEVLVENSVNKHTLNIIFSISSFQCRVLILDENQNVYRKNMPLPVSKKSK